MGPTTLRLLLPVGVCACSVWRSVHLPHILLVYVTTAATAHDDMQQFPV